MLFKKYMKLEYWRLLLYGIHVGHSFKNSILFAAWFIFTYRQNIYIINLYKTLWNIRNGFVGVNYSVRFGHPVWFINIEKSTEVYIKSSAKICGEFSYTTFWIHGMISNYIIMLLSLAKLSRYFKDAWKGTWKKLEMQWFYSRYTWPRSVFISNIFNNRWPSNECTITGIPCLGIVDTNVSGDDTNIATPGNDDSNDSIVFYNSYFSKYIIDKKYGIIVRWLSKIRRKERIISFAEWIRLTFFGKGDKFQQNKYEEFKKFHAIKLKDKTTSKRSLIIKYKFPFLKYFLNGVINFFGMDRFYNKSYYETLDIYEPRYYYKIKPEIYKWMFSLHKDTIFLVRIGKFYSLKSSWKHYGYVRKRNLSESIFRLRLLRGPYLPRIKRGDNFYFTNFILNRFNVNRFYKTFLKRRKFRKNKYVYRYLKFFYLNKYINKIGLLRYYKSIFVKLSSFAHVSFTVCSHNYKNKFFSPFLKNLIYGYKTKVKEYNTLYKWILLKPTITEYLNFIVNNKKINKYVKFLYIYKVFLKLKKTLFRRFWAPGLFWNFNYYLLNWFRSRRLSHLYKKKKKINFILWKRFKKINETNRYLNFFYESMFFRKKFENFFLGIYNINHLHKYNCKYFKLVSKHYRKKMIKLSVSWKYKRVTKFLRHFKKVRRYWLRKRVRTLSVIKRLMKYRMIKRRYYPKLYGLRKRFKANAYMYSLLSKLRKIKTNLESDSVYDIFKLEDDFYHPWYEKQNISKLKIFRRAFKNFYSLKRLYNICNKKYNKENSMNFFEINKIFYNHEILEEWKYEKHFNDLYLNIWNIREKYKTKQLSYFLNKFQKNRKIKEFIIDKYSQTLMRKNSWKKKFLYRNKKNLSYKFLRNLYKSKNNEKIKFESKKLNNIFWCFNYKHWMYNKLGRLDNCKQMIYWVYKRSLNKKYLYFKQVKTAIGYLYLLNFYFYYYKYFILKFGIDNYFEQNNYKKGKIKFI